VEIGKRDSNPVMIKKYDISKSEIEQKDPRAFHVNIFYFTYFYLG
jgi:hypothetical protein